MKKEENMSPQREIVKRVFIDIVKQIKLFMGVQKMENNGVNRVFTDILKEIKIS